MHIGNWALIASLSFLGCSPYSPTAPSQAEPVKSDLEQARSAVSERPSFESYTRLGLVQLRLHDAASAVESFKKSIELSPGSAIAFNNLGAAENERAHWEAAIVALRKALALAPDMQLAKNNLAFALEGSKKAKERISKLESAIGEHSDSASLINLGMEYYTIGEYERAIAAWGRVPTGDLKSWADAQNNIASAAILMKNFALARQSLDRALAAKPNQALYLNNKAWLERAQKSP